MDAFGALSSQVRTLVDLDPQAASQVNLMDIDSAQLQAVRKGSVELDIDSTVVTVDLVGADTLGDIVTRINAAINGIDPTVGDLGIELLSVGGVPARVHRSTSD